jgi:hypothetical protein
MGFLLLFFSLDYYFFAATDIDGNNHIVAEFSSTGGLLVESDHDLLLHWDKLNHDVKKQKGFYSFFFISLILTFVFCRRGDA